MDRRDIERGASADDFWFRGKKQLIRSMLQKWSPSGEELRILNTGAGAGDDLPIIGTFGRVTVIDVDQKALDMIPEGACEQKIVGDACALPFEDDTFDLAVAFDVLEHIEDDVKAVAELKRVLKPGGRFVFSVPANQALFSAHDRALGHFRRYSKSSTRDLFKGWDLKMLNQWNSSLYPIAALKRKLDKDKSDQVDDHSMPGLISQVLYRILALEGRLTARGFPFPFGLSLVGVADPKPS
jgi:SAM-dependent methyltransferase